MTEALTPQERFRLRRSLLSVPAINARALEKSRTLPTDGVIFDLEDSVAESAKQLARDSLKQFAEGHDRPDQQWIIRINGTDTPHHAADLALVRQLQPDAVLLPKAESVEALTQLRDRIGSRSELWAMIETPKAVLKAAALAEAAEDCGLTCFVVGLNDLRKETRIPADPKRRTLLPLLMQVVLAARAYGLDVIDSVSNDFRDLEAFQAECTEGRAMGFDGKMLIHPSQIEAANRAFAPSAEDLAEARAIIAAFSTPEAAALNVINHNGRMIERLHAEAAERLLKTFSRTTNQDEPQ
ncbi:CoA ester lyase [Allorhizobium sp. BGMRC 0089]|uniref:HpcH/HpaI aldolase/citrate lyase family protein n=1 Tax=Allorhizobium sonneratiae TaxID=2934936 RepID=UPI002033C8E8|nr:CoA ester lyase [Allorhizobium sonneratiae]MCM2294382.1 CoA ester lyase [Allorhizobium sonneratiae]